MEELKGKGGETRLLSELDKYYKENREPKMSKVKEHYKMERRDWCVSVWNGWNTIGSCIRI